MLGTTMGSYRITKRLSAGAMGEVFIGEHTLLGRKAAIKLLLPHVCQRPQIIDRFFQEARSTAAIGHPGIVEIFDFGYHSDGRAYIVMEFLDGEVLSARIRRDGKMSLDRSIALLKHVSSALGAAHQKNVIHRDLKPDNIFLVRDPGVRFGERPKILDFGIAKLSDDESTALKTGTGVIMGTPAYMSPEQCRGAGRVDHRADVYSLGCILFELVCGRRPFIAEGSGEVIGMQQFMDPPKPRDIAPHVHPAVEALILQLLAKNPDDRVQNTKALRARLSELEDIADCTETSVPVSAFSATDVPEQGPVPTPITDPVTDLVADMAADPIADMAADPIADMVADPIADMVADPIADMAANRSSRARPRFDTGQRASSHSERSDARHKGRHPTGSNPGIRVSTVPPGSNPGIRASTAPPGSNPGIRASTAPPGSNPGIRASTAPPGSNPGIRASTAPPGSNPGIRASTAPPGSNPGIRASTAPPGSNPGIRASTAPPGSNPGIRVSTAPPIPVAAPVQSSAPQTLPSALQSNPSYSDQPHSMYAATTPADRVSTTLNSAASERMMSTIPPSAPRSKVGLVVGLAALVVAAAGVLFMVGGESGSTDDASGDHAARSAAAAAIPTISRDQTTAGASKTATDIEPEPATDIEPEPATDIEPEPATDIEPEPATDEPTVQPAAKETITLHINSKPSGAYVRLRGQKGVLGRTPYTHEVTRGSDTVTFNLSMRGYHKGRIALSTEKNATTSIKLKKRSKKTSTDIPDITF